MNRRRLLISRYSCLALLEVIIIITSTSSFSSSSSNLVLAQLSPPTNATNLETIPPLSNIVGVSTVGGIKVTGINIGDTDLSVTLKRQPMAGSSSSSNNNASSMSLPVTVIGAKLPVNNLTQASNCLPLSLQIANNSAEVISSIEQRKSSLMPTTGNVNPQVDTTGQTGGSNTEIQTNVPPPSQILSLLEKAQLGAGSIVNTDWSSPQTISMGLLGLGSRVAIPPSSTDPTDCIIVTVVSFVGVTGLGTVPLKQ